MDRERDWPRRRFMRGAVTFAGAVVVGPTVLGVCGDDADGAGGTTTAAAGGGETQTPNAFRLSTRHSKSPCNACKEHARNRYYASAQDAEADRAHDGCRCEVRGQVVPDADAAKYFTGSQTIYDKRND